MVNEKQQAPHLTVQAGPDKGRDFVISPAGARLGRSSGNDIVLADPSLSRFHCRVYFKPDGALWLSDLGSTNLTLVNSQPAQEQPLRNGDILEIGETRIAVIQDRLLPIAGAAPPEPPRFDLGLSSATDQPERHTPGPARNPLLYFALALILPLAAFAVYLIATGRPGSSTNRLPGGKPVTASGARAFDLLYEKEEATTSNVFRYVLTLRQDTLAVRMDDAANQRQVAREKKLAPEVAASFADDLAKLSFFDLREDYPGIPPEGRWNVTDITLTLDRRTHRVRVANRPEPEGLKPVREAIENFAQQELGLAALALPPERLLALAHESFLLGHKLLDERTVRLDNLFQAIRAFRSCQWYLETIEPKPDYYPEAVAAADRAREELDREYRDTRFKVDQAINLSDWERAAVELRRILAMIPDRSDERHQSADKQLLEVERRLRRKP